MAGSFMPRLQTLHLINVQSDLSAVESSKGTCNNNASVLLPRLQTLFLQDIGRDLLRLILCSIAPGPYRIVINLADARSFHSIWKHQDCLPEDSLSTVPLFLEEFNITMLMIEEGWMSGAALHKLLGKLPNLEALSIGYRDIDVEILQALVRPIYYNVRDCNMNFPILSRLHFLYSAFDRHNLNMLKDVVVSHGIQELVIVGTKREYLDQPVKSFVYLENSENDQFTTLIKEWLRSSVPKFILANSLKDVPDCYNFQTHIW
ncbi:hypothetical protein RSOLAG1IB_10524 [Rhizoctonia solani AG-1 IB]|uniref:Uncharacterized protein n=1 Tax=Thanatephorus cucumeris (strain AG1-IB / isolate 7/3/14) TaxID=1108050 RepID=A0A0B7G2X7_THACB|nr:hypothetical protein RSOLAG1IB_10524 [Rhizoctonia solani AG-1 IB]